MLQQNTKRDIVGEEHVRKETNILLENNKRIVFFLQQLQNVKIYFVISE